MDTPSFAEIIKRFNEKPAIVSCPKKAPVKSNESLLDPPVTEKLERKKSDGSNQSSGKL
jgi:hypothetical protein